MLRLAPKVAEVPTSHCDWLPPRFWCCPQCSSTILTRDAAPQCGRCGFKEGT
jgi:hypothetical protein